jgi:hypothetical protein
MPVDSESIWQLSRLALINIAVTLWDDLYGYITISMSFPFEAAQKITTHNIYRYSLSGPPVN